MAYISSVEQSQSANQSTDSSSDASQAGDSRTARIVQVDIGGDSPFICAVGDPVTLKTSKDLRIQIARQDQSQKVLTLAGNLSFSNDNALEIYQAQAKLDQLFIRVKFELLLMLVCLVAVVTMRKYAVRPLEK